MNWLQNKLGLVIILVCILGFIATPVISGDSMTLFEVKPGVQEVNAGDTVEVDITLYSDGGYQGQGLEGYEFVVAIHPDVGEIVNVEAGDWLIHNDGEIEENVTYLDGGAVRIHHERVGQEASKTGSGIAATITINIHDDAPTGTFVIEISEEYSHMYGSDFHTFTWSQSGELTVVDGELSDEESDAVTEPIYGSEDDSNSPAGVITADEVDRDVEESDDTVDEDDELGNAAWWMIGAIGIGSLLIARIGYRLR